MKFGLNLLKTDIIRNHIISKSVPTMLNTTYNVNFKEVAKNVTLSFRFGADKILLPVRTQEVNTDIIFSLDNGRIQIYSNPQAITNCSPDYNALHEFYNKNFKEAFGETEIDYIKAIEVLGKVEDW